jgi:FkbM family methyltransferase
MKTIFLDIGAHVGESIEIACNKKYNFTRIIAIEPSTHCYQYLQKYKDPRIEIYKIGLGNSNKITTLFGAGSVGASLFFEKTPYWSQEEKVQILKFSQWYEQNINKDCKVYIKINTEGAEIELIPELKLIDTSNIASILIAFDIEKIPSLSKYKEYLFNILSDELNIPFIERTKSFAVKEWLESFNEIRNQRNLINLISSVLRLDIPVSRNIRRIIIPFIPRKMWLKLALRFGPNKKR